ncbi:MAG: adenylosuccinate lyase [Clostridiales bacterium]|nr:adenylosuccinate lyase [Clostridiales bacterium]
MLSRYTMPEMGNVWSNENRFQRMLDVEIAAAEAMADMGAIPKEAFLEIKAKAPAAVLQHFEELEAVTGHDLNAFLSAVGEQVGASARYMHLGLTSSDVLDTALSLQMLQAVELLQGRLYHLREILVGLAHKYKYTLMAGRTHGVHAEPITFGLKMALWVKEIDRSVKRLHNARDVVKVGKLSGAVGTFANVDPHIETFVCRRLGLHPAYVTTQTLQRDRHAEFICTIAIIGSSLDKFATEIRNLQRTEIFEVEERRPIGQLSSSCMPHKRNPIFCERVSGLARILRGHALAAMEGIPLWHERDLAHATSERIILPDSCIVLDYMLHIFTYVMEELQVFPATMRKNLDKTLGLVFSQQVLLALLYKGVEREIAYEWVQRNAQTAWEQQSDFQYLVLEDSDITTHLSREEIMDLFDYDYHLRNIDYIFKRAEI